MGTNNFKFNNLHYEKKFSNLMLLLKQQPKKRPRHDEHHWHKNYPGLIAETLKESPA